MLRQRYRYLTAELDYVDTVVCLTLVRVDLGVGIGEINAGGQCIIQIFSEIGKKDV